MAAEGAMRHMVDVTFNDAFIEGGFQDSSGREAAEATAERCRVYLERLCTICEQRDWSPMSPVDPLILGDPLYWWHGDFERVTVPIDDRFIRDAKLISRKMVKYFADHPHELKRMKRHLFEEFIAELWRGIGYYTELNKQTRDEGFDFAAVRGSHSPSTYLVQVKRPNEGNKVSVEAIRSLFYVKSRVTPRRGLLAGAKPTKAVLVTSEAFTRDANRILELEKLDLEGHEYEAIVEWMDTYLALRVLPGP